MGTAHGLGTRDAYFTLSTAEDAVFRVRLAEALAERDEGIMAAYVEEESGLPYRLLRDALADQTMQALVHPVFFGSAITGAGVESLMTGISELLPASAGDPAGPVSGTVFKIERGANGEKIAYVRMFCGTINIRERLRFGRGLEDKVTALTVFERGPAVRRPSVSAGAVGKLWGLSDVQVGDRIGEIGTDASDRHFSPPTLESVVVAGEHDDRARLRLALAQLAEQDPLINVRQDDTRQELSVSLYGEVQKEVIQATLLDEFDLEVTFRETTPIYIERPIGSGEAIEILHAESNPFLATIGLRIDPAPNGSGIDFRLQVDPRTVPLYIYKTIGSFSERMDQYVRLTLREGLLGWQVTDCIVTMTKCVYSVPDGPPSRRGPLSTAADFRKLTPLVLMQALERARTVVCEPIVRASVEIPTGAIGGVMAALARLDAAVETPSLHGTLSMIETVLPATRAQDLQQQLPGLTGGEGVLDSSFAGYQPVSGDQPTRRGDDGAPTQP
jgi:ribosomal protection tetracycline resistance protein